MYFRPYAGERASPVWNTNRKVFVSVTIEGRKEAPVKDPSLLPSSYWNKTVESLQTYNKSTTYDFENIFEKYFVKSL